MKHKVAPSILSADFSALGKAVQLIDQSDADFVHIDVMDGRFVPNLTFGMPIIKAIRSLTKKTFDVHLMMVEPEKYISQFRDAGADIITVHYEACSHLHRTLQQIKETGAKAGVALNPHTSVTLLDDIITEIDLALIMSVNPGFGGQKFIENTYRKVKELKKMAEHQNPQMLIEVDGGVNLKNAAPLVESGVDVLVAGSTVFSSSNPTETISQLKNVPTNRMVV